MNKVIFREPKQPALDSQGMLLDKKKQLNGFTEITNELVKFAFKHKDEAGTINIWTDGNYKLHSLEFVQGTMNESDEAQFVEFELTSYSIVNHCEPDSMITIFWEIFWRENQTSGKFKSYISISSSDNYAKFRSKHQNN